MKTTRFCLICLAAIVGVLTVSQAALAQYTDSMGGGWNNAMSASASTMIWNSIFYRTTGASKGNSRASAPSKTTSQPAQPVKAADPGTVKFRPTGTYIKTRDLASSLGNTPAEREQYQKLMNGVLDGFGQQAQRLGFPNDIAGALAYFLGENIRIYQGAPELSDQQYTTLRNTIADALIATSALGTMTDRQKQEMYEALVAYTGITQYGYEQGKQAGNDAIIKGYQKVAGQNLQTVTKQSPDNLNLTGGALTVNTPSQ